MTRHSPSLLLRFLPVLLLSLPALHAAEEDLPLLRKKKIPAVSLLPKGSELHEVMFPRYDENLHLVGSLKAKAMKLVDEERFSGSSIAIEFFNDDQTPRGRVDLISALIDQGKGMIVARETVSLRSDRLNAQGEGLHYDYESGEGFLVGPAITWIQNPIETTMHPNPSILRTAGLVGMSLVAQVPAAAPPPVSEPEKAALRADAAASTVDPAAANRQTREELSSVLAASEAANASTRAFLQKAELANADAKAPEAPAAKPLDVQPGPGDTVVRCDGGMYFDPDEGVFVYLKNVRVADPRFSLSGANELKIFLGKKEPKAGAKPSPDKKEKSGPAGKFGEVERIVATGAIVIDQKAVDGKDPIKASGALFSYQVKQDQVIISGGYPWVVQGGIALRATQPDLTLRIHPKTGKFDTQGPWDTILPLEQLQKKQP